MSLSRRRFLAASGALVVGLRLSSSSSARAAAGADGPANLGADVPDPARGPSPFLAITPDDQVIVFSPSSEMGQGVTTTLALIVAEELDADWSQVRVVHAPEGKVYRRRVGPGISQQLTGGSTSTALWDAPLRQAGAEARARLVAAAAARLGVQPQDCTVRDGVISAGDAQVRFGEVARDAAHLRAGRVQPKDPERYRLRGTSVPRLDLRDKVTGQAMFGADVRVPDMLFASVVACPVFGGRVGQVDPESERAVRDLRGVRDVLVFDDFVAVVGEHTWAALQGVRELRVRWDEVEAASVSTASLRAERVAALDSGRGAKTLERGPSLDQAPDLLVDATYEVPYLDHLCMAPQNATAHVTADRCTLWVPTQAQTLVLRAARDLTGLSADAITIHTTQLGGGFGRRGYTDDVEQAIRISMRLGRPVQVQWSREESVRHGFYRPAATARLRARQTDQGVQVHARLARQSELDAFLPGFLQNSKIALGLVAEGFSPMPYAFRDYRLEAQRLESPVPVGFWRSVGHSSSAFFVECFIDELAHALDQEPGALRIDLLRDHPRHAAVLRKVLIEAGEPGPGRVHGMAVHESYDSLCAQVVEISMEQGWPRVHRVVCALDCGRVVHPDGARAQLMGGVIFGLSAALYGSIDIQGGRVVQSNFHDAPIVRMPEAPQVESHFVESVDTPLTGVGELAVPPLAPALCNAIFNATGQRIRRLPLTESLEHA